MKRSAQQPANDWQVNSKAEAFVNTYMTVPGGRVGNNPQNLPQPGAEAYPQGNLYGDASRMEQGLAPAMVPPEPAGAKTLTQPWQNTELLAAQSDAISALKLPFTAGPSPLQQQPNAMVMNQELSPSVAEGTTGYVAREPLPSAPMVDWQELQMPARQTGYQPMLSSAAELDPYLAPPVLQGDPRDAMFPALPREKKTRGGRPATMPKA